MQPAAESHAPLEHTLVTVLNDVRSRAQCDIGTPRRLRDLTTFGHGCSCCGLDGRSSDPSVFSRSVGLLFAKIHKDELQA